MSEEQLIPEFAGEKLAMVEPVLRRYVDDGPTRLRYFAGRQLTKDNLGAEQDAHIARLVARVRALTDGVVAGLVARLDSVRGEAMLRITPGRALTAAGEDIVLRSAVAVPFSQLRVPYPSPLPPLSPLPDIAGWPTLATQSTLAAPGAGVVVLMPCKVRESYAPRIFARARTLAEMSEFGNDADDNPYHRERTVDSFAVGFVPLPVSLQAFASATIGRWRNVQAAKIFRDEIAGVALPWTALGAAVALVGIDENRLPVWLDRQAVVRAGGKPKPRVTMRECGEPRVWTARILQADEQFQEDGVLGAAAVNYRHLPPAGFLPREVVAIRKTGDRALRTEAWQIEQRFFPATWAVDVVVVPAEQLDPVLAAARCLAPYDLKRPDRVRLLLAVSQQFFDPQMLDIIPLPQELLDALDSLKKTLAGWRRRHAELFAMGDALQFADTGTHPARPADLSDFNFEAPLALETQFHTTPTAETTCLADALVKFKEDATKTMDEWTWDPDPEKDGEAGTYLQRLIDRQKVVSDVEAKEIARLGYANGLEQFAHFLEAKISAASTRLDLNFLRARIAVRQLSDVIANNSLTSQFSMSDALASVVKNAPAPLDTPRVNQFASQLVASLASPAEAPAQKLRALARGPTDSGSLMPVDHFDGLIAKLDSIIHTGETQETTDALAAMKTQINAANTLLNATVDENSAIKHVLGLMGGANREVSPALLGRLGLDRLQPPLPSATRQAIGGEKDAIYDQLDEFDLALGGLPATDFIAVKDPKVDAAPSRLKFGELLGNRKLQLPVLAGQQDQESRHFVAAVEHGDMALAALRAVEGRLEEYRKLLARCQAAQQAVRGHLAEWNARAGVVADKVVEAAQDVSVAQALLEEEEARIARINTHRAEVLNKHLSRVLYVRPRLVDTAMAVPTHVLEPALATPAVIACLADATLETPPEIEALRDGFRAAPARWFTEVPGWLRFIGKPQPLRDLLARVHGVPLAVPPPISPLAELPAVLRPVFEQHDAIVARYRFPEVRLSALSGLTFAELAEHAREALTLGHLIEHGPIQLAESAAGELARILKVAAGLRLAFGEAPAMARLEWTQRFSQFDEPADFRLIERLPQWDTLGYTLRQRIQAETAWLFSRIEATQTDAVELINNLVRVALLLAAHAPVNQLVAGTVAESLQPIVGRRIRLAVDVSQVRIGMQVTVRNDTGEVVQGIVDDIGAGIASAKILTAPASAIQFGAAARAEFREGGAR